MATLKRTFTNRGKRALKSSELLPNGIYAVRYILPVEEALRRDNAQQEQWGLAVLSASGTVRRTYNVEIEDGWHAGHTDIRLEFWHASKMERQYAIAQEEMESLDVKCKSMHQMIAHRDRRITYFETNRWHRIAERLSRFFSA